MGYRELCSIKTVLFVAWGGAYSGMGPIQRSGEAGTYHPGPLLQAAPFNESIKRTKKKERQ